MACLSLPVFSQSTSVAFFTALGFQIMNAPADEYGSTYLAYGEELQIALVSLPGFIGMIGDRAGGGPYKPVHNAHQSLALAVALEASDPRTVDRRCTAAARMGGILDPVRPETTSTTYNRAVEDPDGRLWALYCPVNASASEDATQQSGGGGLA